MIARVPTALILTADVGGGHLAAGEALAEGLREQGFSVTTEDGLASLGRLARLVFRDGYRAQLRFAPWSFGVMYRVFTTVPPLRGLGSWALSLAGRRRIARQIARATPDVIVSTHPALTSVLGRMRRRRRLAVPVVAPITDMADFPIWSHPGIDVHLVMHHDAVSRVERRAGAGSATIVRPIVARRFLLPRDAAAARASLGLAATGSLVAVSGGAWGVGDLGGGACEALAAGADRVVVVTGDNEAAFAALRRRFGGDPRVEVWGFTDRMDELLRAADVVVHSTGGVTSLEALSCGCPMIAYGCSIGHIRVHNRSMQRLGLLTLADTAADLRSALEAHLAQAPAPGAVVAGDDPAVVTAAARDRILPLPRWRLLVERSLAPLLCVASLYVGLCTDEAWSLVARPLEAQPVTQVATGTHEGALVLLTDPRAVSTLAPRLAARGVHVTFAVPAPMLPSALAAAQAAGDEVITELPSPAPARWLRSRHLLPGQAYLQPSRGMSVGEYVLARTRHAILVGGQALSVGALRSTAPPRAGRIVVITARPGDAVALSSFARRWPVRPVTVSALLASASTSASTAGERNSAQAPPITAATPAISASG